MEVPINNFDDIRPLNNDEVKDAIESLVANEDFERAFRYIEPDVNWKEFSETMRSFKTKEDFKSKLAYEAVMLVANKTTFSLTISGRSRLPKDKKPCTFISNHRDIVLDASFLNVMLYDVGYGMTQVAIGNNLLIRPWIETLVRLNNSFIVKRNIPVRQMLEVSKVLSAYDHRDERVCLDCAARRPRQGFRRPYAGQYPEDVEHERRQGFPVEPDGAEYLPGSDLLRVRPLRLPESKGISAETRRSRVCKVPARRPVEYGDRYSE
jgi:hypothetical protein